MNRKSQQTREHARQTHRTYQGGFPAIGVHRPCGFLSRPFRSALLCLAAALAAGPATAQDPTMDQLWPNTDGLSWTYDQVYHDYYGQEVVQNQVRFFFDGTSIVPGGIVVQNYDYGVIGGAVPALKAPAELESAPEGVRRRGPFWRNFWRARPDLRTKIELRCAKNATDTRPEWLYGMLLNSGAYLKTAEEIAAYRTDQVAMQSWLYLTSDLTVGATFDLQLVPDLADDAWLHGTVAAWEDVTVPVGTFAGCLRVDYRIDYGLSICTNEQGQETGSMRSETRGFVHYASGVGPVQTHEEYIPFAELPSGFCNLDWPVGEPLSEGGLSLTDSQPTPVEEMSWGRLKHHYRDATR
jgi:hypothetical protein